MVQNLAITIPTIYPSMYMHDAASSIDSPTSDSSVTSAFAEIPLTALSKNTQRQLSNLLNSKKILRSEEGYERDWRGIASLAQQKNLCDEVALNGVDPMTKVIQFWCTNNPKTATFANLERFLGIIDRWDVCDDIYENLTEDAKNFNAKVHDRFSSNNNTPNHNGFNGLHDEADGDNMLVPAIELPHEDFGFGSDPNILTKDDVLRAQKGLPPQLYDAFVLFADADINYVVEMLTKLEDSPEHNFKLCLKDRDLLAGVSFAHVALTQLIEERCKHLIVILTVDFLKSPENTFLVNYTQALQIEHKTRKIIPLLYDDGVDVTKTNLRIYTHLKYNNNANGLFNFWSKLAASIRNVNLPAESPKIYIKDNYCSSAQRQMEILKQQLSKLPTPPADIPSININGHAFVHEDEKPKKKDRLKFKKRGSLRTHDNNKVHGLDNGAIMRNAHSTSQLNAGFRDANASLSDLSVASGYSGAKKKKRWPSKLFKKVFSRSSTKLQETA